MKMIHTADLHLGSALAQLPKEKARRRGEELLQTFARLAEYAKREGVYGVLIAGDLFDGEKTPRYWIRAVLSVVRAASPVRFFYVTGNHDENPFDAGEALPENLYRFDKARGFYTYALPENVTVSGIDYAAMGDRNVYQTLALSPETFNIVMMHGNLVQSQYPDKDAVCLPNLWNRGIDYLALGHIHNPPQSAALGTRGKYRYAGCLEGRGFDETGEKGAWLLEIRDKKLVVETFLRFAERTVYEITVDLSGVKDILEARDLALKTASVARDKDVVKLRLKGRVGLEIRRDIPRLATLFENSFFHCKIEDETAAEWNLAAFEKDASLRGEFVRQLSASLLPEDIKSDALAFGLAALAGEDIEI